jgi:hypothetical protein
MTEFRTRRPLPGHVGLYVTHQELNGRRATVADAVHLLSRFNVHAVLPVIANIANFLVQPGTKDLSSQRQLVALFCGEDLRQKLSERTDFGKERGVVVFHRQQQLVLLKLVLLCCPQDGGEAWSDATSHAYAEACLMVNDFLGPEARETVDPRSLLEIAAPMLTNTELFSDQDHLSMVGRAADLWLEIPNEPELLKDGDFVPIAERFEGRYGVSLRDFLYILFMLLVTLEQFDPTKEAPIADLRVNSARFVPESVYPRATLEKVLSIVSRDVADLSHRLFSEPSQSLRFDYSLLRRFPLIREPSGYYLCYDRGLLRKQLTDGIYWLVVDLLAGKEREKFRAFFGDIFARYVERVLAHAYAPGRWPATAGHYYYPRPTFADNRGEVCDGLIDCGGESLILIEVKGALLSTQAKYAGDPDVLERDLEDRFVREKRDKKDKGVRQLSKGIHKLLDGGRINGVPVDLSRCNNMYPVLVSYDANPASNLIQKYLRIRFDEAMRERGPLPLRPTIRPLTVMAPDGLEAFAALAHKHQLNHVLASYRRADERDLMLPFSYFLQNNYKGDNDIEGTWLFDRYDRIHSEVVRLLEGTE